MGNMDIPCSLCDVRQSIYTMQTDIYISSGKPWHWLTQKESPRIHLADNCSLISKGDGFFSQDMMEVDTRTSHCNEKRPLGNPTPANEPKKPAENIMSTSVFVNHAAIAWDESRRKWTGDLSQKSERIPKDPIISWSTTYEDLLSTNDPFPEPIPLAEMVDFLVDIWHDEGLFD